MRRAIARRAAIRRPGLLRGRHATLPLREADSGFQEATAWKRWLSTSLVGAAFGVVEGVGRLAVRLFEHRLGDPDLWVNWNAPWLAALSLGVLFFSVGVVLSVLQVMMPRGVSRVGGLVVAWLGASSVLGVVPGLSPWATRILAAGLSWQLTRLDWRAGRPLRMRAFLVLGGAWFCLFLGVGIWPATSEWRARKFGPAAPVVAPNVLFVVLDTVRANNMSVYGYERDTTPRLAEWTRRGVLFEEARATTPFTLGTHASMFTGRFMSETSARVDAGLDSTHRTLAEHLSDRGYRTAGFVGNIFYGSAHYGLQRGFQHYHDIPGNITRRVNARELIRASVLGSSLVNYLERKWRIMAPMQRMRLDAGQINREALAWLDSAGDSDRPFFLFLNYFDAHAPYSLPPEAQTRFSTVTSDRLEKNLKDLQALQESLDRDGSNSQLAAEVQATSAQVMRQLRGAYDDGIAHIDRELGRLLDEFERRGLIEKTLVVVTSDHGEMLGEHGLVGHGQCLYRQVVHVPLLMFGGPASLAMKAGQVVSDPVSLRDIPATVMDLMGESDQAFPGQSLAGLLDLSEEKSRKPQPVFSEMQAMPWQRRSQRMPAADGPQWLITGGETSYHRQLHELDGVQERLFDLVEDSEEMNNLSLHQSKQAQLHRLRDWFEQTTRSFDQPVVRNRYLP